jgi:hypothetical protein
MAKRRNGLSDYEVISDHLYAVAKIIASSDDPLKLYLDADSIYNQAIDDCVKSVIFEAGK